MCQTCAAPDIGHDPMLAYSLHGSLKMLLQAIRDAMYVHMICQGIVETIKREIMESSP